MRDSVVGVLASAWKRRPHAARSALRCACGAAGTGTSTAPHQTSLQPTVAQRPRPRCPAAVSLAPSLPARKRAQRPNPAVGNSNATLHVMRAVAEARHCSKWDLARLLPISQISGVARCGLSLIAQGMAGCWRRRAGCPAAQHLSTAGRSLRRSGPATGTDA